MNGTRHSIERAHERFNMNSGEAIRFINNALERGMYSKSMPKRERLYMESKEKIADCRTVFYNGIFLVFSSDNVCLTLYEAPKWFCKKRFYSGKELLRNAKKYQINYLSSEQFA